MSEWKTVKIDEIAVSMSMGPFGSDIKTSNFVDDGVPIIRGGNLIDGKFNDDNFVYLTEEKADSLKNSNAFPGDIVFTHRGTLGQVGLIPSKARYPRYVVSQSQMRMTCDVKKADPKFVYYFFLSPIGKNELLSNTSTTGVPAISRPLSSLKKINIPLPPLETQKKIADILSSLDDKIELNTRMNKVLEDIAQALFKHWFVEFEFPNHEGKPYKSSGGKMVDSEMGLIPEGWETVKLDTIIELAYGKPLKADNRINGPYPVYGSNGIIGWHHEWMVKGPGIIVGRKGNPGIVSWSHYDFYPIDTTFYVVSKLGCVANHYLYFLLKSLKLQNLSADSAVPGLNRNSALSRLFVLPPNNNIINFEEIALELFSKLKMIDIENNNLSEIRDGLISKLMNGDVIINE